MATSGAFALCGLWLAGVAVHARADRLSGTATGMEAPTLPGMSPREERPPICGPPGLASRPSDDLRGAHCATTAGGVPTATGLRDAEPGTTVKVAGAGDHCRRPPQGGAMFINLEDETGLVNV